MENARKRAVIASGVGTFIEWYDFFLYGTASALIFNKLFFPQFDPRIGTLLALLTYATGFVARPIGAYLSGHLGDRIGRRQVLLATLLLMGLSTFAMGLVPTYEQIGIWGAVILVVLRLCQGFAAGGEWSGALVLVSESVHEEKRGFWGSWLTSVNQAAFIAGSLVLTLVNSVLSNEAFLSWGWRVPFLISILMVAVGAYIRYRVPESPEFEAVKREQNIEAQPLVQVVKSPRNALAIMAIRIGENVFYYGASVFVLSYCVTFLGVDRSVPLNAILIGALLAVVLAPVGGALADRIGARAVMAAGFLLQAVWVFALFALLNTREPWLIVLGTAVSLAIVNAAVDAVQPKLLTPLFPANVRYSGVAIGRETASIVGGLTPAIATALVGQSGNPWGFAAFLCACSFVGLFGLLATRRVDEPEFSRERSGTKQADGWA